MSVISQHSAVFSMTGTLAPETTAHTLKTTPSRWLPDSVAGFGPSSRDLWVMRARPAVLLPPQLAGRVFSSTNRNREVMQ